MLSKVPEITVYFWIIKILCTTVGETFADYLNSNLGFGINNTIYFMGALLIVALVAQFAVRRYVAPIYWVAVVLISVFGTLITDKLTDDVGVALQVTTVVFAIVLIAVFALWYFVERTLSIHSILTVRREAFYWLAILFTFALGTAAGDLVAEQFNIGYLNSVILFGGIIALIAIAHFGLRANPVVAFWAAYVITRPLGASIGDYLSQDTVDGGLGLGTTVTSLIFLTAILVMVIYLVVTRSDEPGHVGAAPPGRPQDLEELKRFGWIAIAVTVAVTVGAMATASATGIAKSPSAETLAESDDAGGPSVDAPTPAPGAAASTVNVTLSEWSITTSVDTATAGAVTFNITNTGPANSHEFIILKTDLAPDALPLAKDKSLNESGAGITSPGEGGVLAPGKKQTITITMTPGKYVFVDNIVERGLVHWEKKAYATFTVQGGAAVGAATAPAAQSAPITTSVPTPTPPPPPPAVADPRLAIVGGKLGATASATMHTAPGTSCTIIYLHPAGKVSTAKGLGPKTAGTDGVVGWTWLISKGTGVGTGSVTVTCGAERASSPIVIAAT